MPGNVRENLRLSGKMTKMSTKIVGSPLLDVHYGFDVLNNTVWTTKSDTGGSRIFPDDQL